jgi:HSP20 family protein
MFSLVPLKRSHNYSSNKSIDRFFDDPFFRFFNEIDSTFQTWNPAVEVVESENDFVFEFEVPGIEQKHIEISVEDGVLKVIGERTAEESDNRLRSERRYGKFTRSFRLPETADYENIGASLKAGILKIMVPKKEETKPRKIEVQVV